MTAPAATVAALLGRDAPRLAQRLGVTRADARRELQSLLRHTLQSPLASLIAHPERVLGADDEVRYSQLVERRLAGEPVAYLLGSREFHGLAFEVTPAVLIPRPETELLVDLAVEHLPQRAALSVLDLGTGSGCVAITIARLRPAASVTAVDASPQALEVAQRNAVREGVKVRFLQGSWYQPLGGERFDLIRSNPPYVAAGDPHLREDGLPFEPELALVAGPGGLEALHHIVSGAAEHLDCRGWVLLEHGHDQGDAVAALLRSAGFAQISTHADLAGIARVTGGRLLTVVDAGG